ncbi:MAG: glycosyltransferase [Candidatus Omnitrophica bacterium]|nr:glycosyltransferase [Candidatus Omnitrophota bacterium]
MDLFIKKQADYFDQTTERRLQKYSLYFYSLVRKFITSIIPQRKRVLEIGCGRGDLLAATHPSLGVGVDISQKTLQSAQERYTHLEFVLGDIQQIPAGRQFDYLILDGTIDYLEDVGDFLEKIKPFFHSSSRLITINLNPLWARALQRLITVFWKIPKPPQVNLLTFLDLQNLLTLHGFDITTQGFRIFLPLRIPVIAPLLNAVIPRLPFLRYLCLTQYHVVRLKPLALENYSCSVIIPCHNEEQNIEECVRRIPLMGRSTEIIIVDDGSTDKTRDVVGQIIARNDRVRLFCHWPNHGKGTAVKFGFDSAKGDILMILDADMTVMPEELPKFFHALQNGQAEFANGTRMVYPMEAGSMKFVNFLGNKFFGTLLSLIMEQRNTDVLCGTKVFFRRHYPDFKLSGDSWGDFELLFAASRLKLKMAEVPIHYKERKAGVSKMRVFSHGWQFFKNCYRGLRDIP